MTFGVTFSQSTNGRIFDKSVGDMMCGVESVVHQDARYHATTFKKSEKSTALYFMQPRSVQLVARNEESLMWRMTFGVTLGQSTNGREFNKSVSDILCGVESVVHQDARYHATTFKTSEKSTALDFISLVACNLLHEIRNR